MLSVAPWDLLGRFRAARRRRQAQQWVVELDAGVLDDRQAGRLRDWVARPGNEQALRRASQLWDGIDRAVIEARLAGIYAPTGSRQVQRSLASIVMLPTVAALLILAGIQYRSDIWIALVADGRSGTGEMRVMNLGDGSRITLDSQSAVDVAYSGSERRIRLLQGRAQFEVAPAAGRPFLVEARGGETRALGTVFIVDDAGEAVRVDAVEHDITVRKGGAVLLLHPGQATQYGEKLGGLVAGGSRMLGWLRGSITFDNARLDDVAVVLQRYTTKRIFVLGAARGRRYSGVVRTGDPLGALEAMTQANRLVLTNWPGVVFVTAR